MTPDDPLRTVTAAGPDPWATVSFTGLPPPLTEPVAEWPAGLTRYQPLHELGGGGMGVVYLCHDRQLDRQVALKFPGGGRASGGHAAFILGEARAAARLHHPNVCPVFDADVCDGVPYLTMAFIDGPTLAAELKRCGPCPPAFAARLVRTVAEAMQYAHDHGVIHRDLKPANILLTAEREPVVTDFGLAVRQDLQGVAEGVIAGTPHYMAPEQWAGDAVNIGERTDVFALGVILFEMLTGRVPFDGTARQVREKVQTEPIPPVRSLRPDVPAELARVVAKATARRPADRYPSMTAFADALTRTLRTAPPPKRSSPWVFWLVAAAGLIAMLLFLVGLGVMLPLLQQKANVPPVVASLILEGEEFEAADELEKAWASYNRAVEQDPDDPTARERRGNLALKLEKYAEAEADFTVLLRTYPKRADFVSAKGTAAYLRAVAADAVDDKTLERALDATNVALALDPKHARGYQLRADVAVEQKRYADAEADATTAIQLEPDDPVHWRTRALARSLAGDERGSLADADHAAELERRREKGGRPDPFPPLPPPPPVFPPPPGK